MSNKVYKWKGTEVPEDLFYALELVGSANEDLDFAVNKTEPCPILTIKAFNVKSSLVSTMDVSMLTAYKVDLMYWTNILNQLVANLKVVQPDHNDQPITYYDNNSNVFKWDFTVSATAPSSLAMITNIGAEEEPKVAKMSKKESKQFSSLAEMYAMAKPVEDEPVEAVTSKAGVSWEEINEITLKEILKPPMLMGNKKQFDAYNKVFASVDKIKQQPLPGGKVD